MLKNKLLFFVGVVLCLWTFFSVDAALAKTSIATIIDTKGELYDSEFISQTFPTEMIVNQTYACSVTMKNTGSEPWANTDSRKFKLGCFNVGYYWDIPPVELSGSVAPGQTHTFEFNVTPTRAGRTYFNSKMALFGYMWFGDLSDTIWINIKPNDGDDGGGGDDGSGDGGGDSSNSKTLVIFMGGKGDYPEAQFPDFKLAFQLYKEQLISEGKECNVEWLQAPTNVVLRRAEQLAKEFNQWLLNPDNLDTYDNVYIITHCYGYVVTKNAVLRCFDTELPDGFTPHVPDDLTLDQKQKLQDFYKKAKVISISPLLGGEEFAKMKPTGLPIFMSSELNPTGKFQKWLFINDDIFKDNVKDFESHIVVGDRHLKGIWVTRGNATLKQEVQDWLLEHLDPVSFFIDKNKAWYANYEKEKAEGGKHYEYDKSIFNSLPVPVDSDPHFSLLTYEPLITDVGEMIFGDSFEILPTSIYKKRKATTAIKSYCPECDDEYTADLAHVPTESNIQAICDSDPSDPDCLSNLRTEKKYTEADFIASYYYCQDMHEPCEIPGEELVINNLRYYCGDDHLPHLKQDTQGYCETGYECLSGLCSSNACYGDNPIDNIPILDPIDDITVAVGNPIQFYVSANRPTPGTLDYSVTHLPYGATFEYRIFKWTPILTGTYHVLFKVMSNGKFVDYLIVNINVVAPIYNAAKNTTSVRTNMYVNKSYRASVSMKNTGNTCWRKQDGYKLGFYNPIDGSPWNINRVELDDTDVVIPGNIKTFSFEVKSPINEGQYNFQWRMVKEIGASPIWFGEETDNFVVNVTTPNLEAIGNDAKINGHCVAGGAFSELTQGKTYNAWVEVENIGESTWTKGDGYKLGSQNLQDNNDWGLHRVELNPYVTILPPNPKDPDDIRNKVIFEFSIRPTKTGTLNFSWQMVHESVGWFGETLSRPIKVIPPDNHAAFVEYRDVPETMRPGQIYYVSVVMRNTGNTPWRKQDYYRLGYFNMGGGSPWGIDRVELNEGETIYKNQSKTFDLKIVAPMTSGEYHFQWLMVHEDIGWFGQDSEYKVIKVHPDNIYCHNADTNKDWKISHGELLRVIQLMNSGEYHCQAGSEDGYAPGVGEHICQPHSADINNDWKINFTELLRVVQFYNSRGYDLKEGTEDGFTPID